MRILAPTLLLTALTLFSCVTSGPAPDPNRHVVYLYNGTYHGLHSSDGTISNWKLYSDHSLTGEWVTKRNSRSIGIQGHWEYLNDRDIAFEASGEVLVFGITAAKVRITGLGEISANEIAGSFILFVDQAQRWADTGSFEANRTDN